VLRTQYHIESSGVFGSYVHNTHRVDSDLDVLVAFSKTPTLFTLVQLEDELSTLLGVPVDLALKHSLRPRIAQRVLQAVIEL
jgi:uncharacterized protein